MKISDETASDVRYVQRDGRALAYVRAGTGPPLVLVHGWCGDHTHFNPQIAHFGATHDVISVDLRGHGNSDPAPSYTVADFADDVTSLCATLGLERPVVVGHSLGGMVAVEAGASHPEIFRAVVALDAPVVDDPGLREGIQMQIDLFSSAERFRNGAGFLKAALFGPYDDEDVAARLIAAMLEVPPEVSVPALESIRDWPPHRRLLSCRQPALCVHIRSGGPTDPTQMCQAMDNVLIAQTVGAGHFIQIEVPDQVNAMIERFLSVVDAISGAS